VQGVYIVKVVPYSVKLHLGITRPSVMLRRVWSYCSRLGVIRLCYFLLFSHAHVIKGGPGSVLGIVTGYGLDGPGIESQWGRDFLHLSKPALGSNQPPLQWVQGLSGG